MKLVEKFTLLLVVLFSCVFSSFARRPRQQTPAAFYPSPFIADLEIWGALTHDEKIIFYEGWASGLFTATRDPQTQALGSCLEEKLNWELALAMLDKWHADHHEDWKKPMSTEVLKAVTAPGSPCSGMNPGN